MDLSFSIAPFAESIGRVIGEKVKGRNLCKNARKWVVDQAGNLL